MDLIYILLTIISVSLPITIPLVVYAVKKWKINNNYDDYRDYFADGGIGNDTSGNEPKDSDSVSKLSNIKPLDGPK